ncbi:MAG: hypothetical protein JOZ19_03920 [Rubrobacter sp.]|nr:hypothetical protein [Rubrobacter sp.]
MNPKPSSLKKVPTVTSNPFASTLPSMWRKCLDALLDRNAAGSLSWAHRLRKPLQG